MTDRLRSWFPVVVAALWFLLAGVFAFSAGALFSDGRVRLSILCASHAVLWFLIGANFVAQRILDRYQELLNDPSRRWR